MSKRYLVRNNGRVTGPHAAADIAGFYSSSEFQRNAYIQPEGESFWLTASEMRDKFSSVATVPNSSALAAAGNNGIPLDSTALLRELVSLANESLEIQKQQSRWSFSAAVILLMLFLRVFIFGR